jgi:putative NADH-flavin reductase
MITILGAGGAIGNELVKLLSARKQSFRLVGRNPRNVVGATEAISADIADQEQTIRAVAGSSVVHLLVGLKYDHKLWALQSPFPFLQSEIEFFKGVVSSGIEDHQKYRIEAGCHPRMDS